MANKSECKITPTKYQKKCMPFAEHLDYRFSQTGRSTNCWLLYNTDGTPNYNTTSTRCHSPNVWVPGNKKAKTKGFCATPKLRRKQTPQYVHVSPVRKARSPRKSPPRKSPPPRKLAPLRSFPTSPIIHKSRKSKKSKANKRFKKWKDRHPKSPRGIPRLEKFDPKKPGTPDKTSPPRRSPPRQSPPRPTPRQSPPRQQRPQSRFPRYQPPQRQRDASGKIRTIRMSSGVRRYHQQDILEHIGCSDTSQKTIKVCYARVSSRHQMDDLDRQVDYLRHRYPAHHVVTDIASGMSWSRPGFIAILELAIRRIVNEVVVTERDRMSRLGYELIERVLGLGDCKIVVCNQDKDETVEQRLVNDVLNILHVYTCRINGIRRRRKSTM